MTNNHVVEGAKEIIVRLHDRRQFVAELIGRDPRSDVAVLKIDATGLPAARIGKSSELAVGEWVLAIGSPFGFDFSVTAGIVSATGRSLPRENYVPFIQTDVAINPGNSGGPLFNLDGEVVGINSQIYSRTGGFMGLSFSIPIEMAIDIADQLQESGKVSRGWLGVIIQELHVIWQKPIPWIFHMVRLSPEFCPTARQPHLNLRSETLSSDLMVAMSISLSLIHI